MLLSKCPGWLEPGAAAPAGLTQSFTGQTKAAGPCIPLWSSPFALVSMVNLTCSSLLPGILQRRGPACVQLGPSPLPGPSCIPVLWGEGETRIWINRFALTSHRNSTPFSPVGWTRTLPPLLPVPARSLSCALARTLPRRGSRDLQDTHHNHLFLSFLTLRVGRTSEHCRHKTTSFVGHISV